MSRHKVLIIHALRPTSRQTTIDHLLAFREHLPNADVQYLHFAQPLPKGMLDQVEPDLLIVNYDYLNYRFTPLWPYIKNRHRNLARQSRKVIAIAQDDFWAHRLLDNWCMSWKVDRVLTPIDNDLHILYPRTIKRAEFRTVLTGYAPTSVEPSDPLAARPIDLGQRVRAMPAHLGAYAQEKAHQTIEFSRYTREAGFAVDVSTRVEDGIVGAEWSKFLRSCKFTVGMKGGASIADPYGLLYTRVEARRHRHISSYVTPDSVRFLRRRDGKHRFSAISPRLFEAAAAGTCQILRPDDYLGALEPWVHYLPLNHDFSNVHDVIRRMRDLDACQQVATNLRERVIDSGEFGYQKLVTAACGDLTSEASRSNDNHWMSFAGFLRKSSQYCKPHTAHVHDAALHLIHETLSTSRTISEPAKQLIEQQIHQFELSDWFKEQRELAEASPLSFRTPWIWRQLG